MSDDIKHQFRKHFKRRKSLFEHHTKLIFSMMGTALEAVTQFFIDRKEHFNGSTFEWSKITFIEETDMIFFAGYQTHKVGTRVSLENGSIIEITEETAPYFNRPFEVGLPVSLAVSKNKQEIVDYFVRTSEDTTDKLKKIVQSIKDRKLITIDDKEEDFDLSSLTEEQKKSFVLNERKKGKKLN